LPCSCVPAVTGSPPRMHPHDCCPVISANPWNL
jgi:hypothetical protein